MQRIIKKQRLSLLALCVATISGSVIFSACLMPGNRAEQTHFERGETELVIANQASAPVQLFKAGKTMTEAARLAEFDGQRIWLPAGNYFLQTEQSGQQLFYPVPLSGFRQGPEPNGEFAVTIRSKPNLSPPRISPNAPPFVFIPSGHFLYGDRQNPLEPHYVWQQSFFVAAFEITNEEFKSFVNDPTGYDDNANWTEAGRQWKAANKSQSSVTLKVTDDGFKRFGQPDQPVSNVNWFEAVAYCHWLTQKIGANQWLFSLPSEAEWEKAARGPDGFDYGLGMNLSDAEVKLYNWKKNPAAEITVVGWRETRDKYQPNRYGIHHLTGNASEWTMSVNQAASREHPFTDDARNRETTSGARVVRGGSWYSASIATMYIPYRETFEPSVHTPYLGFRVVAKLIP